MSATDWPLLILGFEGEIARARSPGLTMIVLAGEHCDSGTYAESVTLYVYEVFTVGEAV